MKVVFCGTPEFAVPSLRALLEVGHEVALVLTQPDKPAGRGKELNVSAVKRFSLERGLPVEQPAKLKSNDELRGKLEAVRPDIIVVVAYGKIIPNWMLELPRLGNLNVHGSLLPKYRGAAPVQWAVAEGETETGVTIMQLDSGLDTGPVLLERRVSIGPDTMASTLFPQLSQVGAEALIAALDGLAAGTLKSFQQDESKATLAPILTREDGRMDLGDRKARQVYDRWRGSIRGRELMGCFGGKRFLVHRMAVGSAELEAGVMGVVEGALMVGAAGGTALVLEEVQMEGKGKMPGAQFAKDYQLKAGERID